MKTILLKVDKVVDKDSRDASPNLNQPSMIVRLISSSVSNATGTSGKTTFRRIRDLLESAALMPYLFGNRVAQFEAISPKGMSNLYELCFASVQVSVVIFLLPVGFIWPLRKSGEFIVGRLAEREGPESCFATVVQ